MHVRPIAETDWLAIVQLERKAYALLPAETEAVLRSKQHLSPATCFAVDDHQHELLGYCLAHPYPANACPALNTRSRHAEQSSNLFIHDVAVQAAHQHHGIGGLLFKHVSAAAVELGFRSMSLVAVGKSAPFWAKMGFEIDLTVCIDKSYGDAARFMTRPV